MRHSPQSVVAPRRESRPRAFDFDPRIPITMGYRAEASVAVHRATATTLCSTDRAPLVASPCCVPLRRLASPRVASENTHRDLALIFPSAIGKSHWNGGEWPIEGSCRCVPARVFLFIWTGAGYKYYYRVGDWVTVRFLPATVRALFQLYRRSLDQPRGPFRLSLSLSLPRTERNEERSAMIEGR